ncbi:glycosyltransferase family 1 protein [Aquimarina muelleri]|uniref:Glycosyltransferase EpsF n=1 Tax=Aquimarina muelleri TaxID=279356 RepID=A0A918N540_9FLAO|nr:glycosyltransferase family 1 protein [Aquimarina muelleri]MCX2762889.1 glycosyltransferase family 1 protein [Aquimarina muelleri]GGX27094.1 putative glycosyltransferase EpsF [Aquimarina muelleri]
MAAIRVLQIFTIMNRGGAESMIMNYYRNIDRSKVQFDFLVHRKEKAAFDDEIQEMGGKIYRLDPINPLSPNSYYRQLRGFFKEHQEYEIVHSHLNTFSCFPLKIAKEFNIPCRIAHAHIAIEKIKIAELFTGGEGLKETFKKLIKFQLKKRINKYATHHFSCGEKAGNWLFPKNTPFTIMNNAIDAKAFIYNPAISIQYKEKYKLEDKFVIGHVGRFTSQKNHLYILNVFNSILEKKENCSLVFIGDGPLREKIENEAKKLSIYDKILFLGVRSDIPELYQMLDAFIFPSFYEGLPVTLIEAQSAGLSVFASDKITEEVYLTEDIEFLSIEESPDIWADKILEKIAKEKADNFDCIKNKGYDIEENIKVFQEFYLTKKFE